jgi:hypothetical protein
MGASKLRVGFDRLPVLVDCTSLSWSVLSPLRRLRQQLFAVSANRSPSNLAGYTTLFKAKFVNCNRPAATPPEGHLQLSRR